MKKISLCIDARMKHSSGIGTYLRNLLPFFEKSGAFAVTLLEDKISPYSWQEQLILPIKIPHCDLFWSPHFNVPLLPVRAKRRIVTIHDVFLVTEMSPLKPHEKWYASLLLKKAVHASTLVMTDSGFSKQEILKYFPIREDKIQAIHLGIDHALFSALQGNAVLQRYGVDFPYFLFVGNLKPHKNIEGLLAAYKLFLSSQDRKEHLVLIGKEFASYPILQKIEKDPQLQRQVHVLQNVTDEDLPAFYQQALATILPSFYEGFGFPPLEAMSAGSPVIISSIPSLVEVCGDAVLKINPVDPVSLCEALRRITQEPQLREKLSALGKERVSAFQWEKAAERYIHTFLCAST